MHPDVGFIANVDDRFAGLNRKGRLNNRIYRVAAGAAAEAGRPPRRWPPAAALTSGVRSVAMTPSEGYRLLDRHVSPMLSAPVRDLVAEDASAWLSEPAAGVLRAARGRRRGGRCSCTSSPAGRGPGCCTPCSRRRASCTSSATAARSPARSSSSPGGPGSAAPEAWTFGPLSDEDDGALARVGPVVPGAGRPGVEAADGGVRRGARRDAGRELAGAALRGRGRAPPRAGAAAARPPRPGVERRASSGRLRRSSSLPPEPAPTGTSCPPRDVEMLERRAGRRRSRLTATSAGG